MRDSAMLKGKLPVIIAAVLFFLFLNVSSNAYAFELSGFAAAQGAWFSSEPLYAEQEENNWSLAAEPEFYQQWGNGGFTLKPFYRVDGADGERTHFDVREAMFLWYGDTWEIHVGVGKVFWGQTESQHLVDIVNQTDLVDALDGEEKLGQPMANLTFIRGWGTLDLFVLPYFRERTFPGEKGRLRPLVAVDTDNAVYESADEERHIDYAARFGRTFGDLEVGLSYFSGTGREPTLLQQPGAGGVTIVPYYEQISQAGIDLLFVAGGWLLKTEGIYRSGQGDDNYFARTVGFEYTFSGVAFLGIGGIDIGVMGEWLHDDRGSDATTAFESDIMAGMRVAFNDAASTEALLGVVQDLDEETRIFTFESSRRLGESWKISMEAFVVLEAASDGPMYMVRNDDYVQLELFYYF